MSDIWEMVFKAQNLSPEGDEDLDGFTNFQEAVAGTNPRSASSQPPVPSMASAGGTTTISWKTVAGKSYRVQTSDSLDANAVWSPLGTVMLGDGSDLTATFGTSTAVKKYFRLQISDYDSDNDGANDWEERQLGFDPMRADTRNSGFGDKQAIIIALQSVNTIEVSAPDGVATQAFGDTATLRFTRAGNIDAVSARYSLSGTAVPRADYPALSGSVSFPIGVNVVDVPVSIAASATITSQKSVIATLVSSSAYLVGTSGSAKVNLSPLPVDGQLIQEIWSLSGGYSGLDDVPFSSPPTSSRIIRMLDAVSDIGDTYGARIRGYITAPTTGNYTFWVSADDVADFSLSTNQQPANLIRRCYTGSYTNYQEWNKFPTQKSGLVALTAGQRYYFEARLREYGGGDHLTVGWLKPGQNSTEPSQVIPGTVLTSYVPPFNPPGLTTLYFAPLSREAGVNNSASGFATVRLSQDETVALVSIDTRSLSGKPTALNIRGPANSNQTGNLIKNLQAGPVQSDGTYIWQVSPATIKSLKNGQIYLSVVTALNRSGELRGQFGRALASGRFTPPADPPALATTLPTANEAARFLIQASFGPTKDDLAIVRRDGYSSWIDAQFAMPISFHLPIIDGVLSSGQPIDTNTTQEAFWKTAITAPDQLRQRVSLALSELMVISATDGGLANEPYALSGYADMLLKNSFGNFRQLLEDVTLSPAMGLFLDMLENDKANPITGTVPNENYGREIMQLFTIGLAKLNPDGSILLDDNGNPIQTYGQEEVIGFSNVFTGWNFAQEGFYWEYVRENWRQPMKLVPSHHDTGPKRLLDGLVLPGGQTGEQDLKDALDVLFNHPNCGPFIARSLIQRLVTSNPSPAYVYRVAKKFADNGNGVRGDMKAVVKAILLDYEARSSTMISNVSFGKQREPMIRLANIYRAFNGSAYNNRFLIPGYEIRPYLGQAFLEAPSVFNFFSPFYSMPGELANKGLLSPEFQITTDTTAISSSNLIRNRITYVKSSSSPSTVGIDLSAQVALASNPTALVDSLNNLLLAGQMPDGLRTQVIKAVSSQPLNNPLLRAQTAVQLITTSPRFCVQK